MKRVLLLSMPFGAVGRQALGLSLLKVRLVESGIVCDVRYFPFTFAEFIGYSEYQWIASNLPYTAFAGDWTFTHTLYGERPAAESRLSRKCFETPGDSAMRRSVASCEFGRSPLTSLTIAWPPYRGICMPSSVSHPPSSRTSHHLALATRVKTAHPKIAIVFGGANWEGEMGLRRSMPELRMSESSCPFRRWPPWCERCIYCRRLRRWRGGREQFFHLCPG